MVTGVWTQGLLFASTTWAAPTALWIYLFIHSFILLLRDKFSITLPWLASHQDPPAYVLQVAKITFSCLKSPSGSPTCFKIKLIYTLNSMLNKLWLQLTLLASFYHDQPDTSHLALWKTWLFSPCVSDSAFSIQLDSIPQSPLEQLLPRKCALVS
jgi:hypothetical protein